jgi:hypothetical protein
MPEDRLFRHPVIILGAPRSGTSLLHRIIRAQPGFRSTAGESDAVWGKLTHPALNDWAAEGWPGTRLNECERQDLHRRLARLSLDSRLWRRVDAQAVGEHQHRSAVLARIIRSGYRLLAGFAARAPTEEILVEKSVHSALWLDLLDEAFPDARYVHIVRRPEDNLRSMIRAWLHPERFFTYNVPADLQITGYPFQRWNFALPPGWRDYTEQPLERVVAFQWAALQGRIADFTLAQARPVLRVRLEDLVDEPRLELERVAGHLGLEWNRHLEAFSTSLPAVNRSSQDPATTIEWEGDIRDALAPYRALGRAIGY